MEVLEEQETRLGKLATGGQECVPHIPTRNEALIDGVIKMTPEEYNRRLKKLSHSEYLAIMDRVNEILANGEREGISSMIGSGVPLDLAFSNFVNCKSLYNEDFFVLKTLLLVLMEYNHNYINVGNQLEQRSLLVARNVKEMNIDTFQSFLELMTQEQFAKMMIGIKSILKENGIRKGRTASSHEDRYKIFTSLLETYSYYLSMNAYNQIELRCLLAIILGEKSDYEFYNVLKNHCVSLSQTNQRLINLPL